MSLLLDDKNDPSPQSIFVVSFLKLSFGSGQAALLGKKGRADIKIRADYKNKALSFFQNNVARRKYKNVNVTTKTLCPSLPGTSWILAPEVLYPGNLFSSVWPALLYPTWQHSICVCWENQKTLGYWEATNVLERPVVTKLDMGSGLGRTLVPVGPTQLLMSFTGWGHMKLPPIDPAGRSSDTAKFAICHFLFMRRNYIVQQLTVT